MFARYFKVSVVALAAIVVTGCAGTSAPSASSQAAATPLAVAGVATPAPTPAPTPKAVPKAAPVSYKKLTSRGWKKIVKSPDNYIGKGYQLWACIHQFDAATGEDHFLANASYKKQEYWNLYGENTAFNGDAARLSDFVEGDVVVMNVVGTGSYSFDTQAGGNTTVPSFDVKKITRKGSCD